MSLLTALVPLHVHARLTGRAWWALRYTDGRVVDEREVDWSQAPYRNRYALQLVCPNGQVGQVGNSLSAEGRLLQFKIAFADVELGGVPGGRTVGAQIIGLVKDISGTVQCWAWESNPGRLVGPFLTSWWNFTGPNNTYVVGRLSADVLGVKPD